jgi:hypothetical protein
MLNPSTADEIDNDPTVARCERRAMDLGYGGLEVVNLFALRSTDPEPLYTHPDPVGPENDKAILDAVTGAGLVVCAWGKHGKLLQRAAHVLRLLRNAGVTVHCLKLNQDRTPTHPLYVGYDIQPRVWFKGG